MKPTNSVLAALAGALQAKRDRLKDGLEEVGFGVLDSQGTYFLTADIRPLGAEDDGEAFCRYITVAAGVSAVPVSAFFADGKGADAPRHFVRFRFAKSDATLEDAVARLARHFGAPTTGRQGGPAA